MERTVRMVLKAIMGSQDCQENLASLGQEETP